MPVDLYRRLHQRRDTEQVLQIKGEIWPPHPHTFALTFGLFGNWNPPHRSCAVRRRNRTTMTGSGGSRQERGGAVADHLLRTFCSHEFVQEGKKKTKTQKSLKVSWVPSHSAATRRRFMCRGTSAVALQMPARFTGSSAGFCGEGELRIQGGGSTRPGWARPGWARLGSARPRLQPLVK